MIKTSYGRVRWALHRSGIARTLNQASSNRGAPMSAYVEVAVPWPSLARYACRWYATRLVETQQVGILRRRYLFRGVVA